MNAGIGLLLWTLSGVDGVPPGRFAVAEAQLIAVPTAETGRRFALTGQLQQYASPRPDADAAERFAIKGAVIAPGACSEVVYRDGYE